MDHQNLKSRAEAYFAAVDEMNLNRVLSFFHPDAVFHIPTHGLMYKGRDDEISNMYQRLFKRYKTVWHGEFEHVVEPPDKIACRFQVKNTSHENVKSFKSNCNYFYLQGDLFSSVYVYMTGENSLS